MLRTRDVPEGVTSKVSDLDPIGQRVCDQRPGRLGEHDLTAVTGCSDACGTTHLETAVIVTGQVGLARVETHPDAYVGPRRPIVGHEATLRGDRRRDRGSRLREDREHRVALGADGDTTVLVDGVPDDAHVRGIDGVPALTKGTDEPHRPLDVRSQESDRPRR